MPRRQSRPATDADLVERLARAEESLAHLSKLQESILASAGEGVYGTDTRGRITFVNPAAAALLGYQPEELIGKPAHDTLHHSRPDGSHYPGDECPIARAFQEGESLHAENEVYWRKDGSSFPVSFTYTPMIDDGSVVGAVLVFRDITERKEAQERLAKSERDLREAHEVAHVGSWSWDVGSDTITWSDELFRIYGIDPQSFDPSFAAYTERLLPEERPWITDLIAKAIEHRRSFRFDHRVVHRDGSVRWVEGRGRVIENERGELCLVGTAMDITDRVEARSRLEESEERYRSIFENAVEGIYRSSLDGRLLAINPAGARLLGYDSPNEAMAAVHNLRHVYAAPAQRDELIRKLREAGSISRFEVQIRRVDGAVIWAELSVRVIGDPNDPGSFMEGMMLDISSRKAAEAYLNQSEARTKAIVTAAPNGIITFSETGQLIDMNPAAERIFGHRREDVAGADISTLLDLRSRSAGDSRLSATPDAAGTEGEIEAIGLTSGGQVPLEVAITPARLGGDRFFIAHVRDLTDQRRMEQARKDLELQVTHMQKMEALGHLAGGIVHDFNNLLAVIHNYAAFMRDELGPDTPMSHDVDQVLAAARRATALTRQLVMFSRRDATSPEVLDLNDVVLEMERLLRRVIGPHIQVVTELRAPLWPAMMDVGQLEQVIMNLALNARDAMPDGGTLTLSTGHALVDGTTARSKPGLQAGAYVVLSVSDTGCGIPDSVRDRVFEPFFTSKEKGQGTGLGLATVFGIVKKARGHVAFDSDLGFGTTFHVYLPAHQVHAGLDATEAGSDSLKVVTEERHRELRGPGDRSGSAERERPPRDD